MEVGDVKGKGRIYNETGELILIEGEEIIAKFDEEVMGVITGWSGFWCDTIMDSHAGEGKYYITNKRLVFIRTPNPEATWKSNMGTTIGNPFGIFDAIPDSLKARELKRRGYKEYCVIYLEEIVKIKRIKGGGYVYLISNGKKYRTAPGENKLKAILEALKQNNLKVEIR